MLESILGKDNENMILIIILILLLFGKDLFGGKDGFGGKHGFGGGLFDDNIIWILILFLFLGDVF